MWSHRCRSDSSISEAAPGQQCFNATCAFRSMLIPFVSRAMLPICYSLLHSHCYLVSYIEGFRCAFAWFMSRIFVHFRQHSSLSSDMWTHSGASLLETLPFGHEQPTQPKAKYCATKPTANASTDEHLIELCRCISGKHFMWFGRLEWSPQLSWAPKRHGEWGGDLFRLQYDAGEATSRISLIEQEQRWWNAIIVYGHQIR